MSWLQAVALGFRGVGAAGTWRDDYPTLEDYWPTINSDGDVLVSGNLDQWVGRIAGWVYAAPSSVQRPTPGANGGWQFTRANSVMMESLNSDLLALFEAKNSWSKVMRLTFDVNQTQDMWVQFLNPSNNVRAFELTSGGFSCRKAVDGVNDATEPVFIAAPGTITFGYVYDGIDETLTPYLNGVGGTVIPSSASMPTLGRSFLGTFTGSGSFLDGAIKEALLFSSPLNATEMADIHGHLVMDYPE